MAATDDTAGPRSRIVKRSLSLDGHRTSVSLEEPFWETLRTLAAARGSSVQKLVAAVDHGRGAQNLSSALRVFVLRELLRAQPPGWAEAAGGRMSSGGSSGGTSGAG